MLSKLSLDTSQQGRNNNAMNHHNQHEIFVLNNESLKQESLKSFIICHYSFQGLEFAVYRVFLFRFCVFVFFYF